MLIQEMLDSALEDARAARFATAEKKLRLLLAEPLKAQDLGTIQGLLGVVYASGGNQAAAIRELSAATLKKPEDATILSNLSKCLNEAGRTDEAISAGRKSVALNPRFAAARNNLGNALMAGEDLEGAVASFREAVHIDPGNGEFHNNLGVARKEIGDLDGAVASYRQALTLMPGLAAAYNNIGVVHHVRESHEAAETSFRMAIKHDPDFADAHNNLGLVLAARGDFDGAIASARRALEIDPNSLGANTALRNALNANGDLDDAGASYRELLKWHPDNADFNNTLGDILAERHELDAAISSYRKALAIDPDFAAAHTNLGDALRGKGEFEQAISSYQDALRLRPGDTNTHENLASVLVQLERYDEALRNFDLADSRKARAEALMCLYALERYDDFDRRVRENLARDSVNLSVAATCGLVYGQIAREDPHPFCSEPLAFVNVGQIGGHVDDLDRYLAELGRELREVPGVWAPVSRTTRHGFQTHGNLFSKGKKSIATLQRIIESEIAAYRKRFDNRDCLFMKRWPENSSITGWSVRLLKDGHQRPHIHPTGWVSGVIYVELVDSPGPDDGAIVFGQNRDFFPVINPDSPRLLHRPKRGEIVLFPSSLYHHTIPIRRDGERLTVSFDLLPG
ncbi:MAG: tetratricopeptide repeat protein [Proteobacteria bacterium]|nr:tetratricopeptide repeat protein [Pseudomonadota bacterium]